MPSQATAIMTIMDTKVTYVIRRGLDGPIKIGTSADPEARLKQLQTACAERLWLVGVTNEIESVLHDLFSKERISGEWFRASHLVCEMLYEWGIDLAPTPEPPPGLPKAVTWSDYLALVHMGVAPPSEWPRRVAA